ncbi:hypothetical protein ACFV9G_22895 [Nocardioides sp. NPDC059952]|uniref:hypothetical protein n=1 Tax=Nocardioides sp. NPDC059952 TaxID=3347014 RepID=UPI003664AAC2
MTEVPQIADLGGLPVEVVSLESPGVVAVTAWANDGDTVTLTWDEIAGSASVRWIAGEETRLSLERELLSKISVREEAAGRVEFWIWSESPELGGQLIVRVGVRVSVEDALLRV